MKKLMYYIASDSDIIDIISRGIEYDQNEKIHLFDSKTVAREVGVERKALADSKGFIVLAVLAEAKDIHEEYSRTDGTVYTYTDNITPDHIALESIRPFIFIKPQ